MVRFITVAHVTTNHRLLYVKQFRIELHSVDEWSKRSKVFLLPLRIRTRMGRKTSIVSKNQEHFRIKLNTLQFFLFQLKLVFSYYYQLVLKCVEKQKHASLLQIETVQEIQTRLNKTNDF
ncbi:hypothetical protein AQUCO_01700289v1 [Aquilegia coerulea]|uniref:Uncharacterized protein n=1 Tax=Aquilegia coerulea TaxID=218851 RepID=A0A2G5DM37_AQUCA|nr:hypothetical protein AQUCO_01700289v1 [Aquilegia coerulea]